MIDALKVKILYLMFHTLTVSESYNTAESNRLFNCSNMANNVVVKEEIDIKDEICEDLTELNGTRDFSSSRLNPSFDNPPRTLITDIIQSSDNGFLGIDNDIHGVFSTETIGSKTLVVFRRLPGPLPEKAVVAQKSKKYRINSVTECMKCGRHITSKRIKIHMRICNKYFNCQRCTFKTKKEKSLIKHKELCHLNSNNLILNECTKCKRIFDSKVRLKYHTRRCGITKYYYCNMCPYKSSKKKILTLHFQSQHCPNSTVIADDYVKTKRSIHHGKFTRFCSKCNISMESNSTVDCTSCTAECLMKCKQCSRTFNSYNALSYHLRAQCNPEGYYHCPKCDFRSGYFGNMRNHLKSSHSESNIDLCSITWQKVPRDANGLKIPIHTCSKCGLTFETSKELNQHISLCRKTAEILVELDSFIGKNRGLQINSVEKKIIRHCDKCNEDIKCAEGCSRKQFCAGCQSKLRFKCTMCDKLYNLYGHAVEHLKSTCDSEETFKCNNCDFKARLRSEILKHNRRVHGDISATCTQCGSEYTDARHFKKHLLRCGKDRTFQCDHCPYKGKFKRDIRNHLNSWHTKQLVDHKENSTINSKDSHTVTPMRAYHFCFTCNKRKGLPYRVKICEICKSVMHLWCINCERTFASDDLKVCEHIKACLDTFQHECERCGRNFSSPGKLTFHKGRCRKVIHYSCSFCPNIFCSEENLLRHEQRKHSNTLNEQHAVSTSKRKRSPHRANNFTQTRSDHCPDRRKSKRDFSCQKCNVIFVKNSDYIRHLKFCERKLRMQCKVLLTRLKINKS